jgi:hypothetical protein
MSSKPASNNRAASYKKGIDADNSRRNREATSISIRTAKREEGMQKRRGGAGGAAAVEAPPVAGVAGATMTISVANIAQMSAAADANAGVVVVAGGCSLPERWLFLTQLLHITRGPCP